MAKKHDDGGPASSKTLLDDFAGQAMRAMLGRCARTFSHVADDGEPGAREMAQVFDRDMAIDNGAGVEEIVGDAYAFAAGMVAEKRRREKAE